MDSGISRENGIASPNNDSIAFVCQRCNCDEETAKTLLKRSKGNPERAVRYLALDSKYIPRLSPRPSPAATATPPRADISSRDGTSRGSTPNEKFRPLPDAEARTPSVHSLRSSECGSNAKSPGLHIVAHYPQFLAPSQNGDLKKIPEVLNAQLDLSNTSEKIPSEGGVTEPNSKDGSPDLELEDDEPGEIEWDLVLPVIPLTQYNIVSNFSGDIQSFSINDLIGAVQNGANIHAVQNYLERFDPTRIREHINDVVKGFPAIFYIVETNKEELLRLWAFYGGDPTATHEESKIPLLAFAIMHSEKIQQDTTPMTTTFLSLGASPDVIPSAFYLPYIQDLPETGPGDDRLTDLTDDNKRWCKGAARDTLARTATLSQRYYLERAIKTKKPSVRQIQVAQKRNAEPLLGIANFLIGQTSAAKTLLDKLLSHLTVPNKKPLVLVFAGPSGHGKTALARCLGNLLSLALEVVDCTTFNREMELFGPRPGLVGADKGSRLNNFLASNHGKRCIVFLDEFDKTNSDIHKTLLLPFDNGEYADRRNQDKIDCSQTIWILATNRHDPIIQTFSADHKQKLFDNNNETEKERLLKQLAKQIKQDFLTNHGSPITGRISAFVPFLPFSEGEQAVIIHRHLLDLGRSIRSPISLTPSSERLIGNIRLRIRRDASVCKLLAKDEYNTDLGARSLLTAVEGIKTLMVEEYLGVDEEIVEGSGMSEFVIDVVGGEVVGRIIPSKTIR
ncbi:MAG: hypothetical protein M1822_002429 [Bathelium mastoideum]|nr:MAG: hypothetical protein M1822_002429 [Bathelium mastoideum]